MTLYSAYFIVIQDTEVRPDFLLYFLQGFEDASTRLTTLQYLWCETEWGGFRFANNFGPNALAGRGVIVVKAPLSVYLVCIVASGARHEFVVRRAIPIGGCISRRGSGPRRTDRRIRVNCLCDATHSREHRGGCRAKQLPWDVHVTRNKMSRLLLP